MNLFENLSIGKKNIARYVIILVILGFFGCGGSTEPIAVEGILDLGNNPRATYRLVGEWKLYWKQFLPPEVPLPETGFTKANQPSHWNKQVNTGIGFGTYVLKIRNYPEEEDLAFKILYIYSAYELYVNNKLIRKVGKISQEKESEVQDYLPDIIRFQNPGKEELEIRLLVSNHVSYRGGIGNPILFGTFDNIREEKEIAIATDVVVFGSLFFIGIYHIGFYVFRRREKSTLYFGLFCISIGLRTLFTGGSGFVFNKIQFLSWESEVRTNFCLLYSAILFFSCFLQETFPEEYPRLPFRTVLYSQIFLFLFSILTPLYYTVSTVIILPPLVFGVLILSLYVILLALKRRKSGSIFYSIGFLFLSLTAINDLLYDNRILSTGLLLPFGAIFFVIFYAFSISKSFSVAFSQVEHLSQSTLEQSKLLEEQNFLLESKNYEIMQINSAYQKFIPKEFLNLLNKESITNFQLGDHTEKEMTILFSDIRSFSSLSESMLPEDNFEFINGYLRRIGPLIREHNGFIDKYIGDAIMALFPKSVDDGINAAIDMLLEVGRYNEFRMKKGRLPIAIGTGINTGQLILGIVGEENRMNSTVISDSVNLASRLESLTKYYKSSILISDQTYKKISDPEKYIYRVLDTVRVKGKKEIVSIIEILNGNSQEYIDKRVETKENFEFGLILFQAGDFVNSIKFFTNVLSVDPNDTAAQLYLRRSEYYSTHGAPPNWVGIVELQNK